MKKNNSLTRSFGMCLTAALLAASPMAASAQETPPKPDLITIAGYGPGSSTFITVGGWSEGVQKKFGTKIRMNAMGSGKARMAAIRGSAVDTAVNGYDVLFAQEGMYGYSAPEWGPQSLRLVYQCEVAHHTSLLISQSAWEDGVKTAADLKGRKIGVTPGIPDIEIQAEGTLAFADLTWEDVEVIDSGSYGALRQMLLDGSVDAAFISSISKEALQMEASPRGVHFVPLPHDDTEGWERFLQKNPMRWPALATAGAGASEDNPLETSKEPWPLLASYDELDGAKAYWATKSIRESFDLYKDVAASLPGCDLDATLKKIPMYVPWHEGSKKYLQEVGVWTDAMEENQNALISRQAALRELWDQASEEAAAEGIEADDWADFWLAKRAENFPDYYIELP